MARLRLLLGDMIIIAVFAVAGLGGLVYNLTGGGAGDQQYIQVRVDNKLVAEFSAASHEERNFTFPFGKDNRYRAILEVNGGRVRMLPMGKDLCPRGICSHTGWISNHYESIVCIPNRIMVTFTSNAGDNDLDGITY